jgi:hypothetical protein
MMENEAKILILTYKHIDECVEMERNYGGTKAKETRELFSDQKTTSDGITSLSYMGNDLEIFH